MSILRRSLFWNRGRFFTKRVIPPSCYGCGSKIQTTDPKALGYFLTGEKKIPKNYLDKMAARRAKESSENSMPNSKKNKKLERYRKKGSTDKNKSGFEHSDGICVRCHQLRFQGKTKIGNDMDLSDFRIGLSRIIEKHPRCAILLLIDVFDFYGTSIKDLEEIVGHQNPVVVAVNKIDLMPTGCSSTKLNKMAFQGTIDLKMWIFDTLLISGKENMNLGRLRDVFVSLMEKEYTEVFVVGTTNVGKSTLINGLKKKNYLLGDKKNKLTTSMFPGTTIETMEYRMDINPKIMKLFDTPGIVNKKQIYCHMNFDEIRALTPTKKLRPNTFKLGENQSLLLGAGLGRIDLVSGRPIYVTVYVNHAVSIHISKQDKVDNLLKNHTGKLVSPPFTYERLEELGVQKPRRIKSCGLGWNRSVCDVVFSGLGWVSVTTCGEFEFDISGVSSYNIDVREPLLPFESNKSYRKFTGTAKRT